MCRQEIMAFIGNNIVRQSIQSTAQKAMQVIAHHHDVMGRYGNNNAQHQQHQRVPLVIDDPVFSLRG